MLIARSQFKAAADLFDEIGSLPDAAWARRKAGDAQAADAFYRSVGADLSIWAR